MTDFVPSVFNALVSMADSNRGLLSRMGSLRELVVGGEEINPRMAHRLTELLPQVRITNGYGPTEASIGMVFHPVSAADGDTIPLGRPIDNCYAVIVDEQMDLTPPGEAGELVIGGACLGSGYLGDPVRTGEVFVPNPFPEVPGARLYRTGDVARFDKLGRLHFLGRRDSQVKIGGVRLELGEIEAAANRCRGVWHSKVLPVDRGSGRSLALFVAGEPGLTRTGVREQLTNLLPRHHLPRHVVVVEAMPLNGNGKVDRAALLAVLEQRLAGGTPAESSAGLLDRVLWVFRNTLGQPDLEPDDNFHHAGGDSIQSVTAAAALTHEAALTIGVQDLFDCPTASAMASLIEHRQLTSAEDLPDELWRHDLALAEPVAVRAPEPTRAMRRVLVTGATGFVGSRLVHELLTSTELAVECVVRGEHDEDARSRVIGALEEQGLWDKRFDDRLTAYAGDLSRPRLGLAAASWDHLAATCDLVLHNGALVNLVFDYHAHRGPNVLGTCEVLRLAMSHHAKPLHHVSTLGVLDEEAGRRVDNGGEPLSEALDLATSPPPPSGYSRSKWLAEQLLSGASRRGASITVYRLGEIVPSGDNGRPNPRALTHLLLSAFLRLGVSPQVPMRSDYTPVDYAARRVVAGIQDPAVWGQVLHVFHPESVCYADALARVAQPVDRVSCRAFLARLAEAAHDTGDRELNTLLALLNPPPVADEATLRRLFTRLLADNPRLFRKDQCRQLEQRWGLTDEWLYQPIAAYRDHLSLI
jgi:thioester reductase-like protein